MNNKQIVELVRDTLVNAGSTFKQDKKDAYARAIASETNEKAKWVLQTILDNADAAENHKSPLCDDTGIPHVVLEIGPNAAVTGNMLDAIKKGIEDVLRIIDEESYVSCSGEQQFYRGCVTEFRYGDGYIRLISEPWMDTVAYCHQSLRDKISDLQQELFPE